MNGITGYSKFKGAKYQLIKTIDDQPLNADSIFADDKHTIELFEEFIHSLSFISTYMNREEQNPPAIEQLNIVGQYH